MSTAVAAAGPNTDVPDYIKQNNVTTGSPVTDFAIGKYCLVRTRNEGLNFGLVVSADHTGVVIKNAQRLWYFKPSVQEASWYEGVALYGTSNDSKISHPAPYKVIVEEYSLTICTDVAIASLLDMTPHAQSS